MYLNDWARSNGISVVWVPDYPPPYDTGEGYVHVINPQNGKAAVFRSDNGEAYGVGDRDTTGRHILESEMQLRSYLGMTSAPAGGGGGNNRPNLNPNDSSLYPPPGTNPKSPADIPKYLPSKIGDYIFLGALGLILVKIFGR